MDFQSQVDNGFYAAAGKIAPARISLKVIEDPERTAIENRPIKKEVEWIEIFVDQGTIVESSWQRLEDHYKEAYSGLYRSFQDRKLPTTVDGTPLSDLTWMSRARAEEYAGLNVFTVEHLSNLKEETIKRAGMGAREEVAKAKAYLKAAADTKHTAKLAKELEQLKERLVILEEEKDQLAAALKEERKKVS
jgi:hypothetical protein